MTYIKATRTTYAEGQAPIDIVRPDPETLQWVHDMLTRYEYPGEPAASLARARRIIRDEADIYGIEVTE